MQNKDYFIYKISNFIFIIIKISNKRNPSQEEIRKLENQLKFKIPLYTSVFTDWIASFWLIGYLMEHHSEMGVLKVLGALLMMGLMAGSNINVSHELFHKHDVVDKFLGTMTLAKNYYMHFSIEHVFGHHRRVATPEVT